MNTPFSYIAFGIRIQSEIELPELLPMVMDGAPDLDIRLGTIPEDFLPPATSHYPVSEYADGSYKLLLPGIARYLVREGREVIIDPLDTGDAGSLRLFLLSMVLPAALHHRGKVLIHASAIQVDGQLKLFLGQSRAGKSSTVAALKARGYRVFTDDVCVLEEYPGEARIYAHAAYPMMKLWEETVDMLGDAGFAKTHKVRPQLQKFGQFFHADFDPGAYPVESIYILQPLEGELPVPESLYGHQSLKGLEAFEKISQHTYRSQFIRTEAQRIRHLGLISRLVQQARVTEVYRSKSKSTISGFADYMVQLF